MEPTSLAQSPFAVLTLIVAPAILTNDTSVLAMSTINRMLRTRDRMHKLFAQSEGKTFPSMEPGWLLTQVNRVEKQGALLLLALRSIYVALGAFSTAALVTILGAGLASIHEAF